MSNNDIYKYKNISMRTRYWIKKKFYQIYNNNNKYWYNIETLKYIGIQSLIGV